MGGIGRVKDRLEQSRLKPSEANNKYLHVWHLGLVGEPSAFQKCWATSLIQVCSCSTQSCSLGQTECPCLQFYRWTSLGLGLANNLCNFSCVNSQGLSS